MYHSRMLGSVSEVHESYYAISPERKLKHPAVLAITQAAREVLLEQNC
jgi:LysR family transcriptional activator of nhaA